jgi:CBS domain-containing protein/RNA polymerase-binding transcription factor DksA
MDTEVKAFMTGEPRSIEPDASALAALDLMIDHAIRHLPVVDENGRVCGVLSFDDLRAALPVPLNLRAPLSVDDRRRLPDLAVGEMMTFAPVVIRSDAPLEEAVDKMVSGRFGCLPVVDEAGRLDGIITETDLLQVLLTVLWSERRGERAPDPVDLQTALENEQRYLTEKLAAYERREQAITESHRELPLDLAEQGSDLEEAVLTERLAELASRRLRAIEHALDRQSRGELSICEHCGERIADARLRALPGTNLCIRCSRAAETGQ